MPSTISSWKAFTVSWLLNASVQALLKLVAIHILTTQPPSQPITTSVSATGIESPQSPQWNLQWRLSVVWWATVPRKPSLFENSEGLQSRPSLKHLQCGRWMEWMSLPNKDVTIHVVNSGKKNTQNLDLAFPSLPHLVLSLSFFLVWWWIFSKKCCMELCEHLVHVRVGISDYCLSPQPSGETVLGLSLCFHDTHPKYRLHQLWCGSALALLKSINVFPSNTQIQSKWERFSVRFSLNGQAPESSCDDAPSLHAKVLLHTGSHWHPQGWEDRYQEVRGQPERRRWACLRQGEGTDHLARPAPECIAGVAILRGFRFWCSTWKWAWLGLSSSPEKSIDRSRWCPVAVEGPSMIEWPTIVMSERHVATPLNASIRIARGKPGDLRLTTCDYNALGAQARIGTSSTASCMTKSLVTSSVTCWPNRWCCVGRIKIGNEIKIPGLSVSYCPVNLATSGSDKRLHTARELVWKSVLPGDTWKRKPVWRDVLCVGWVG